jgi:tRNA1Val (adenine37-N6)-methyltransferase
MKIGTDAVLLGAWAEVAEADSILDIGTGSGILALMMAQRTKARIDAVEIDAETAKQAGQNIAISPWPGRIRVHTASFQEFANTQNQSFDRVISNPPYFSNALKSPDPARCMARHDDSLPVNEFMNGVGKLLQDSGQLSVIIPFEARDSWIMEASLYGLMPLRMSAVIPRQGKPASRLMIEFRKGKNHTCREEEMVIRDLNGEYTDQYKRMTFEYYLGL